MKPQIFTSTEEPLVKQLGKATDTIESLNLSGKVILITGATEGIGKTLSILAAYAGAQTLLLDKSIPALESLYNDIMTIDGAVEPFLLPVDLAGANLDDYLTIAEQLSQTIPQLDGIIHNAAHFAGLYALMQTPPEDLIKQIHVNYTAPIWLTQAFFDLLKKSPQPTLLFADHQESYAEDTAYFNTYAGAKIALMQAVKQLAMEHENLGLVAYGYNIGWVNTVLSREAFPNANPDWPEVSDAALSGRILQLFERSAENGSIVDVS